MRAWAVVNAMVALVFSGICIETMILSPDKVPLHVSVLILIFASSVSGHIITEIILERIERRKSSMNRSDERR